MQYLTIEDPWVFDPDGLGSSHDLWRVHPWVGDLYVRDRLEYEGFTANIGLRADYWFLGPRGRAGAGRHARTTNITPGTRDDVLRRHALVLRPPLQDALSPRVIVAHPITENSSFFFNYGAVHPDPLVPLRVLEADLDLERVVPAAQATPT